MPNRKEVTALTTRRRLLTSSAVGAASALAGCDTDLGLIEEDLSIEPPPAIGPLETDWPQFGYDAGRTRYVPNGVCPSIGYSLEWEMRPRRNSAPQLVVEGNLLVVTGDETLYAFDPSGGERAWTAGLNRPDDRDQPGDIQPAIDDRHVYAARTETELAAFDRTTGDRVWTAPLPDTITNLSVHDGVVYVPTYDGVTVAFDAGQGTERWRRQQSGSSVVPPVVTDEVVFVSPGNSVPDESRTDGKAVREVRGIGDPAARGASLYGSYNSVQSDRYLQAFEVSHNESNPGLLKQWERPIPAPGDVHDPKYHVPIALGPSKLYVLAERTLYVLDRASGDTIRTIDHQAEEARIAAVCGGTVFVQAEWGVGPIDLATGTLKSFSQGAESTPADLKGDTRGVVVAGDWVFKTRTTGHLYGFTPD